MKRPWMISRVVLFFLSIAGSRGIGVRAAEPGRAAADVATLAAEIIEAADLERGLCSLLSVGDGELALELGSSGDFVVHGWDSRAADVATARARVDAAGLHGRGITVETGTLRALPYANDLVDLIVHLDLREDDLQTLRLQEVLRVLRPGGKAILGRLASAPGEGISTALKTWLTAVDSVPALFRDDELVEWMVLTRPPRAGQDDWSHWEHGPDNNPVSDDTVIKAPYLTQWLGAPYYIAMPAITTAASGRIFIAIGHIAHHKREEVWLNTLMARNGYNGTVLWTRKLPDGYLVHRSAFVASADTFYMIDADGRGCLMLDARTGEEKGRLQSPRLRGEWKWIALKDGVLYALVGGRKDPPETTVVRSKLSHWSWGELSKGYYGKRVPWGFGRSVAAFDPKSKQVLWRHDEAEDIDSRAMTIGDGRIFFYCPDKHIACLDLKTGEEVWANADPLVRELIEEEGRGLSSTPGFRTMNFCLYTPDVLVYQAQTRMNAVALSTKNGYLLWNKRKTTNNPNALFVDGQVMIGLGESGSTLAVDPVSGKVQKDLGFRKVSCARLTATTDSFFCRGFPEGLTRYDRVKQRTFFNGAVRPSCNDGVIAANGLLYTGPWLCDCNLSLMGRVALCSADSFTGQSTSRSVERFARMTPTTPAALDVSSRDWETYRGGNERGAATAVPVPELGNRLWHEQPEQSFRPTVPTTAAGLVLIAGDDGKVRAYDGIDGSLKWSFLTTGPILRPPSIAVGKAYVGSGDGYVYCLEVATGNLLWRYRVAPAERRIPVYGTLSSTWPVHSGVLVEGGVAYAAAGIIDYDGTYVCALDAESGEVKWTNDTSGHLDPELRKGVSAQGSLTIAGGRLWLAGGNVVSPAAYDLETGAYVGPKMGDGSPKSNRGEEVGVFADRFVTQGGRLRFSATKNVVNPAYFTAQRLDSASAKDSRPMRFQRGKIPPAWDDERMVVVDGIGALPKCYDALDIVRYLEQGREKLWPRSLWAGYALDGRDTVAVCLAANAVVTLSEQQQKRSLSTQWFVSALRLNDGALLWEKRLPGAALAGGLAVDRDGRVVVVLEDGDLVCFGDEDQFTQRVTWLLERSAERPELHRRAVRLLNETLDEAQSAVAQNFAYERLKKLGVQIDAEGRARGAITTWQFTGSVPYDSEDSLDKVFVGEPAVNLEETVRIGNRLLNWRQTITKDPHGAVVLTRLVGGLNHVACYFHSEFLLDADRDLVLRIGSDDGFKCWVNGEEVGRFEGVRGFERDQNSVAVKGRSGSNQILLKIAQVTGAWAFNVRLTDATGQPIRFVRPGEAQ